MFKNNSHAIQAQENSSSSHLLEHFGKFQMRTKNRTSRILADFFERLGFLICSACFGRGS